MSQAISRPHAPLMWILIPILIGYGVAEEFPWAVGDNTFALVVLCLVSALGAWWGKTKNSKASPWYFAICVTALAALTYNMREGKHEIAAGLRAPREARLVIEIQQTFATKNPDKVGGIGIIRTAPGSMSELLGERVCYMSVSRLESPTENGQEVLFDGVLSRLEEKPDTIQSTRHPYIQKSTHRRPPTDDGFNEFLSRQHVEWTLTRGEALGIAHPANPVLHFAALLHQRALAILKDRWDTSRQDGMLPAMVLGEKSGLTQEQIDNLSQSSTTHLIVADGLNVAAVAAVLWVLARLTGLSRLGQAVLIVVCLGVYALMVGAAPSVLRAWGMVTIVLGCWAMRKQMNLWAILVLAAIVSLLVEPLCFLHAGWRLSFAVVGGIILGMNAMERLGVLSKTKGIFGWLARTLVVSIMASLAVAPLTAAYWGIAQPLGFLVNAVTVTLGEIIKILGTSSFLLGWAPWIYKTINEVAGRLCWCVEWIIGAYLKVPWAVMGVGGAKSSGIEVWGTVGVLTVMYLVARYAGKAKPV